MSLVLKVAVPFPLRRSFDYWPPAAIDPMRLRPGIRIEVPFGRRNTVGYLLGVGENESLDPAKLKPVLAVLDDEPLLSDDDRAILLWASRYYHHPIGEVFATAFPVHLRQGRSAVTESQRVLCLTGLAGAHALSGRAPRQALLLQWLRERSVPLQELAALEWDWRGPVRALIDKGWACWRESGARLSPIATDMSQEGDSVPLTEVDSTVPALNAAQQDAVGAVTEALDGYRAFLLEGVTGSGKTEVYLRLVDSVLRRGAQAMVLLPEISLTPQLEALFRSRFSVSLVVFHSGLNESERCRSWLAMQRGEASILLGTRSAVFTPLARPGIIILDEEHDASFKQHEGFRFSARDVAVMRARQLHVPVLLGSATPSLESLHNARSGRYVHLALPERAGASVHPTFRRIDIRNQLLDEGLSPALIGQIGETLARGEQSLLFLNRRGFAPTLICHACGWVAECKRCDARLVAHAGERRLRCHHCGHEQAWLRDCPNCRTADLRPLGQGTERVEQALARLFPQARILRIDRDSTRRKGSLERMLERVQSGEVNILLGTQMLAKGHHFPNVTLVGILDVDGGLFSLDFRAGERTAQLIVQVAGRAGREERPGLVLLQTRQPEHPLLRRLIREGYASFAEAALAERRVAGLPPYTYQALWRAEANDAQLPQRLLKRLCELAGDCHPGEVQVLGPVPAPMARLAGRHRWQLLLQSPRRRPLHGLVEFLVQRLPLFPETHQVRWSVDIDPVDLY
ncbi:MAG: primosomal protein N' [Methylococcaceae bacterium]|nr:primosomal protein N' [Methylococcaceae bacterium]